MSQSTLSRALALRIGLAAKALPDTQPKELVTVLIACLGIPIDQTKLNKLTKKQYHQALNTVLSRTFPDASLDESLKLLREDDNEKLSRPRLKLYRPDEMPHSIRVAVASLDGIYVDGNFTACKQFYIYQVSGEEQRLIAIRPAEAEDSLKADENQSYRAEVIQDCQVLYSQSIGGPAAAKVIKLGVHPIKISTVSAIRELLEQLQHVLSNSPPPWLAKRMDPSGKTLNRMTQEQML
ncbi:MAG: NifB/NifX family molybdenum-iron cluster-binding protein [Gammaproteobacteria bacterium]